MKRHVILTALITVYAVFMAVYFGSDLLRQGQYARFGITLGAEVVVLVLMFFMLRKRDRLRSQRRQDKGKRS